MEKAAARNDSRKVYQLLDESTGKKMQRSTPTLLRKDNKLLMVGEGAPSPPENDHSQPIPSHNSSEPPSVYEDCNIAPLSGGEIIHAIKLLKNNKSPGIDELPAELMNALP